ncbi:MAG: hypothetical protein J6Z49_02350 [Kiritimatiellae bacterium]|nr:hypothetical protein [Kiritimatiellia bacterium]
MRKFIFGIIVIVASVATLPCVAAGAAFTYQGVIKEVGGAVPANKNRTVQFRIYDGPATDTPLWGRAYNVLLDANGLFNTAITDAAGSEIDGVTSTGLASILARNSGTTLYIGLTVDNSSGEISPRQALLAVPYAIHASDAAAASGDFTVEGQTTLKGGLAVQGTMNAGALSATSLSVTGNISAGASGAFSGYGITPVGGIIMWSGSASNIPDGWKLCNGSNGTPDLRGRFIVGYDSRDTSYNSVGKTGGANTVTLTESQMPRHRHEYVGDDQLENIESGCSTKLRATTSRYDADSKMGGSWSSGVYGTSYVGNGDAHENRPPYYTLCFIMRVK